MSVYIRLSLWLTHQESERPLAWYYRRKVFVRCVLYAILSFMTIVSGNKIIQCVPKVMVGFQMIILLEWNRCQTKDKLTKFSISRLVELGIMGGGRKGGQAVAHATYPRWRSISEWFTEDGALRTWHPWIFICGGMWSKPSTVFVFTTFNTWNSESGKLLHLSLLMFLVECGRKWNTA
jgi:hypothetical protein